MIDHDRDTPGRWGVAKGSRGGAASPYGRGAWVGPGAKRFGVPVLIGSVVAAGLLGGAAGVESRAQPAGGGAVVASGPAAPTQITVNSTDGPASITAVAQKATPGVVTISASSTAAAGTGSGIVLDSQGHILTNTHVVTLDGQSAAASIDVRTSDGSVYPGTIVGIDPLSDLAVVKIDAPNLVPAVLGDSSKVNVGDTAIAIGAPLGLQDTVTNGIISALGRSISIASSAPQAPGSSNGNNGRRYRFAPPNGVGGSSPAAQADISLDVLQTDAAVNPGNSGGPLLNARGEVIGVNVAIASAGATTAGSQSGSIGVGFAIEINNAKRIVQEIIANGSATHGQLGAAVTSHPAEAGSQFNVGAEVTTVTSGSAAEAAGIQKGDIITGINGRSIQDADQLTAAVRDQPGGASVRITLLRGGRDQQMDVKLGTAPKT
ncbi:trypsin-like peptidase domain-containing protein [Pseudarthrobacter sp. fls2-241-R2A-127]|uniref:S1C family serine protease n=1 Tax=Pseudarthrobacter sp. fls2-241-R2A-127 TaxID=3040303 RepID=UPI002553E00E|nr:trypsin-like peptidase domain-containing protein [Pseudarthrobacter sp. fls2-241-R2A-127]